MHCHCCFYFWVQFLSLEWHSCDRERRVLSSNSAPTIMISCAWSFSVELLTLSVIFNDSLNLLSLTWRNFEMGPAQEGLNRTKSVIEFLCNVGKWKTVQLFSFWLTGFRLKYEKHSRHTQSSLKICFLFFRTWIYLNIRFAINIITGDVAWNPPLQLIEKLIYCSPSQMNAATREQAGFEILLHHSASITGRERFEIDRAISHFRN